MSEGIDHRLDELVAGAPIGGRVCFNPGSDFSFPPAAAPQLFAMRSKVFTRAIRVLMGGGIEAGVCPVAVRTGDLLTGIEIGGFVAVAEGGASSKSPHPSSSSAASLSFGCCGTVGAGLGVPKLAQPALALWRFCILDHDCCCCGGGWKDCGEAECAVGLDRKAKGSGLDKVGGFWVDCCGAPELKVPNSAKRSADMFVGRTL